MKIGIVIGKPTQFEGPFFRYMVGHTDHTLRVIYTNLEQIERIYDPEIGTSFTWGIDVLGGYPYDVLPKHGRWRWLLKHFRREKYDFLILNGYKGVYLFAAGVARLYGTSIALRLDSVLFNNVAAGKRLLKKGMFFIFGRLYQHFFAVGSLTVEYLRYFGIPGGRISVFSYVVDRDYFREQSRLSLSDKLVIKQRYALPERSMIILSVAKFNEREAPWDLLKAFCSIQRQDLSLLLVGDGEQRARLEAYARTHASCHIVFAGYVPYPQLPAIYSIADVFVHPARNEPWGVSIAEAQACGLPVIASSEVGAGHDHITPGINGYIYSAGDSEDLKNKLNSVLDHCNGDDLLRENERVLTQRDYAATLGSVIEAGERYLKVACG